MNPQTVDDVCEADEAAAVKPVLQQIVQVQEAEMRQHPKGSLEYNKAILEWSKANAALCRANGNTDMQTEYEREVRHYQRLVDVQETTP